MSPRPSRQRPLVLPLLLAAVAFLAGACGGGGSTTPQASDTPDEPDCTGLACDRVALDAQGTAGTLDVGTWNVEWFGDPGNGPDDEALQQLLVAEIMADADLDVWSIQEVVSEGAFARLVDSLPGYDGLLANDPSVRNGPQYYNDFDGNEQKVGLVWKTDLVEVTAARIILTGFDFEFAGRPPLEVEVRVTVDGTPFDAIFIALHAKAGADQEDWERRTDAAAALKNHLDTTWPDTPVWIVGDFNDDVDVSIHAGEITPYSPFLDDPDAWRFATAALTAAGVTSTVNFGDVIDHILVSDESWGRYVDGSATVLDLRASVSDYGTDASDHYPVLARFNPQR